MALASGTADPMKQRALEEAAKKQKTQVSTPVQPEQKNNPLMTSAAMKARGLVTPTKQSGNFAKSLREEVARNEEIVAAGGVAPQPSDSMSFSQQAQRGMAQGMKVQDRDAQGNVIKDYGTTIGQTNQQSIENFKRAQEQAFYGGGVAPSRSQFLTSTPVAPKGTTTVQTTSGKKNIPTNATFQKYIEEQHPFVKQGEDKIRRLNSLRSKLQAGGNIDDATMKELQAMGVEADPVLVGQAIARLTKKMDAYKTSRNVPGGYLTWQEGQGTDVATQTTVPTEGTTSTPVQTGGETGTTTTGETATSATEGTTTQAGATPTQGTGQPQGAQTSEGIASLGGDMFAGQPASASMAAIQSGTLGQQRMNEQIYGDTASMAMDTYGVAESARANQLRRALAGSNAVDAGINLGAMTLPQLEQLASESGLDLSQDTKDRIQAGGRAQIENMLMEKNERMQYIELDRRGIEREYGRALTEREDFNVQQDTRLRRLLGAFGGGVVQSIGGNAEVMRSLEKGVQAKEDLLSDFADKKTEIGLRAQTAIREYSYNTRVVEANMASQQEQAYSALTEKLDGLLSMGVTNKKELDTAMLAAKKEFAKTYADIAKEAMIAIVAENDKLFDRSLQIQELQMKDDEALSAAYGIIFRGGAPVTDQSGNTIPTLDKMQFQNDVDYRRSQMEGIIYQNGVPLLDGKGNPVPTFDANKYQTETTGYYIGADGQMHRSIAGQRLDQDAIQSQRTYDLAKDTYNLSSDKFTYEMAKDADEFTRTLLKDGLETGRIDENGRVVMGGNVYNPNGTKYAPSTNGSEVRFNVKTDSKGNPQLWSALREQCGEFVNDAFGKKIMGDSYASKVAKIATRIPLIGSAFVQAISGKGAQYGHTGLVEGVDRDNEGRPIGMSIIDSNFHQNGKPERAYIDISYDAKGNAIYKRNGVTQNITGFTDSVLGDMKNLVTDTTKKDFVVSPSGMVLGKMAGEKETQSVLAGIPKEYLSAVTGKANQFDSEQQVKQFQTIQSTMDTIRGIPDNTKNPSDDQNLIYAFARIMDPTSAVKEGEYKTVQDYAQSLFNKYSAGMNQAFTGEGFLTEQARKNIKKTLENKYKTSEKEYTNIRSQYIRSIDSLAGQSVGEKVLQDYQLGEGTSGYATDSQFKTLIEALKNTKL